MLIVDSNHSSSLLATQIALFIQQSITFFITSNNAFLLQQIFSYLDVLQPKETYGGLLTWK